MGGNNYSEEERGHVGPISGSPCHMLRTPIIPGHIARVHMWSIHTIASKISEPEPPYLEEKLLKAVFLNTTNRRSNDKNPNSSQVDV